MTGKYADTEAGRDDSEEEGWEVRSCKICRLGERQGGRQI
jgi:hypothetical protein